MSNGERIKPHKARPSQRFQAPAWQAAPAPSGRERREIKAKDEGGVLHTSPFPRLSARRRPQVISGPNQAPTGLDLVVFKARNGQNQVLTKDQN